MESLNHIASMSPVITNESGIVSLKCLIVVSSVLGNALMNIYLNVGSLIFAESSSTFLSTATDTNVLLSVRD